MSATLPPLLMCLRVSDKSKRVGLSSLCWFHHWHIHRLPVPRKKTCAALFRTGQHHLCGFSPHTSCLPLSTRSTPSSCIRLYDYLEILGIICTITIGQDLERVMDGPPTCPSDRRQQRWSNGTSLGRFLTKWPYREGVPIVGQFLRSKIDQPDSYSDWP